ncbi:MAG: RIP metalloprotease RseP [Verrucomicrobia subdivision 3 bacterium]|nr:RIP metalloprotease RseP [Limisphaerales bacterium]
MDVLKVIFIVLEVLLLFNVLIFAHELGHFLAAKWRGLKVERFAIWFGKPLWKKNIGGVEYILGTIPAGGYVSLPQMAPMEVLEGKADQPREELPPVSALDKIIVAFAGPLFSFGLAIAFALIVWAVGRPVSQSESTTVVGFVETNSPAERAGIKVGDRIVAVDGKPVSKFGGMGDSITWRIVRSEDKVIPIVVERNGERLLLEAEPRKEKTHFWQRASLRQILIEPAYTPVVSKMEKNSPALFAGLKAGDEVHEVGGNKIYHLVGLINHIQKAGTNAITLTIRRDSEFKHVTLSPEIVEIPGEGKKPLIGVTEWSGIIRIVHPGVFEQIHASVDAMVSTFGALFSRKSDIKPQHLSGAVKIMNIYYVLFKSEQGWRLALWFSVIMNVNLAILNLLPIPVLDGGHILLAIVEGIRRRPVSIRILQALQTSCAVIIIGYMLYIAFYDVQELPWNRKADKRPEIKFSPKLGPPPAQP